MFRLVPLATFLGLLIVGLLWIGYDGVDPSRRATYLGLALSVVLVWVCAGVLTGVHMARRQHRSTSSGSRGPLPRWGRFAMVLAPTAGIVVTSALHDSIAYLLVLVSGLAFILALVIAVVVERARLQAPGAPA